MTNHFGEQPIKVRLKIAVAPTGEMPLMLGVYDVLCIAPDGIGVKIDAGWQCARSGGVWLHPSEYEVVAYGSLHPQNEEVANA